MNDDVERSSQPRKLIHDLQQECYKWEMVCERFHHGLDVEGVTVDGDDAEREFYINLMGFLRQLSRFAAEKQASDIWDEEVVFETSTGEEQTLDDIFSVEERLNLSDRETGGSVVTTTSQLTLKQMMKTLSQADKMAHTLKFDAEPGEYEADPEDAIV